MDHLLQTETIIIELLLIASIVAVAVQWVRLPYTVALVLVGLVLTLQGGFRIELTQEIIMALFLPPLLFEAAFHVDFEELRPRWSSILGLAMVGVFAGTFIVGGIVSWGASLAFPVALVFGALIAATDPVAVIAIFRTVGAPKKLATLVEGESLFNDGAAVVVFNIALAVALTGHFSLLEGAWEFVKVSVGGIAIGLGLGWLTAQVIARLDDYLVETTLTTVLAFGSFIIAEQLHMSGVLAVVAAGILNGNIGPSGMSASTRIVLFNFWEYLAFLANSLIFLLIGLEMELSLLFDNIRPVIVAILGVWAARVICVYGVSWLINRVERNPIPLAWQHILSWGGLRGAVSLALVLGLPSELGPERSVIQAMAFGVVLVTLLLQATTIESLIRWLGLAGRSEQVIQYERTRGRLLSLRAAHDRLEEMYEQGELSNRTWSILKPDIEEAEQETVDRLHQLVTENPLLEEREVTQARRELLLTQRGALYALQHDGLIDSEVFENLATEFDRKLDELGEEAH